MLRFEKLLVIAIAALGIMLHASFVLATKYKAPANEVLLLPRFCWSQYLVGVDGPAYSIEGCGVWMNHYCEGLLMFNRARKPNAKLGERIQNLTRAKEDTLYTLEHMTDYPACMIRQHAETTLKEINAMLRVYGRQ